MRSVLVPCALFFGSTLAAALQGGDPIAQQAYLKASNTGADDWFGFAVAASGDTLVVGAPREGAAYVFVRSASSWSQQAVLFKGSAGNFGYSVSISGDTLVVGAYGESSAGFFPDYSGAAYVFVRNGTTWSEEARLVASNSEAGDKFGFHVSVAGDTAVVGAIGEDSNATGVNGDEGDNGAFDSGAAYVFVRSGTSWSQQAYLKASNTEAEDQFGWSLSVSGYTLAVGAWMEDSSATGVDGNQADNSAELSGATYVFERSGTSWSQQAYLKASNTEATDTFGLSVSLSGDTLLVGAEGEDSNATGVDGDQGNNAGINSGAAYVFARNGASWSQQAYLKSSLPWPSISGFGVAVSLSDDMAVVASYGGPGAPGDACLLERSGTSWSHQARLLASNPDLLDQFGSSLSVSGTTIVVGAFGEDSNATGVDGNQSNNSALGAGAAYVFGPVNGPYLTAVTPSAIEALIPGTAQTIQLAGQSLDLATGLTLDGVVVDALRTTLVSPELLTLDMPQVASLGTHYLAVTDGANTNRFAVTVVAPAMPRYENASGDPFVVVDRDDGLSLRLAGIPGRVHLVFVSTSNLPSTNRFVSLGLGNQFTSLVNSGVQRVIPAAGWIEVLVPSSSLMSPSLIGIPLYSQTIELTFPAPLPVSNLQSLLLVP